MNTSIQKQYNHDLIRYTKMEPKKDMFDNNHGRRERSTEPTKRTFPMMYDSRKIAPRHYPRETPAAMPPTKQHKSFSRFFFQSRRIVRPMYQQPPKQKHCINTEKSIFTTNRRPLAPPPTPNIHCSNRSTRNHKTEVQKNIAIKSTSAAEKHHRRHFVAILLRI